MDRVENCFVFCLIQQAYTHTTLYPSVYMLFGYWICVCTSIPDTLGLFFGGSTAVFLFYGVLPLLCTSVYLCTRYPAACCRLGRCCVSGVISSVPCQRTALVNHHPLRSTRASHIIMGETSEPRGVPPLQELRDCLLDLTQPIAKRTHSAFFLRTLGTAEAVSTVGEGECV